MNKTNVELLSCSSWLIDQLKFLLVELGNSPFCHTGQKVKFLFLSSLQNLPTKSTLTYEIRYLLNYPAFRVSVLYSYPTFFTSWNILWGSATIDYLIINHIIVLHVQWNPVCSSLCYWICLCDIFFYMGQISWWFWLWKSLSFFLYFAHHPCSAMNSGSCPPWRAPPNALTLQRRHSKNLSIV